MRDEFDPENIRRDDMIALADSIEEYKEMFLSVMVIPDSILRECEDKLKEALRRTDKLIKKLRKGDKDIFVGEDEYESELY